jgi:hypothetical protein
MLTILTVLLLACMAFAWVVVVALVLFAVYSIVASIWDAIRPEEPHGD